MRRPASILPASLLLLLALGLAGVLAFAEGPWNVRMRMFPRDNPHLQFSPVGSGNVQLYPFPQWNSYMSGPWMWDVETGSWYTGAHLEDYLATTGPRRLKVLGACESEDYETIVQMQVVEIPDGTFEYIWHWPLDFPTAPLTVRWVNQLAANRIVVVETRLLVAGRLRWSTVQTFYPTTSKDPVQFEAIPCQGVQVQYSISVWARTLDPEAPDELLQGTFYPAQLTAPRTYTVNVSSPLPVQDVEGFNVGDKVSLRSLPGLLGGLRSDVQDQTRQLVAALGAVGGSGGGGGGDVTTAAEKEAKEGDQGETNSLALRIAAGLQKIMPMATPAALNAISNVTGDPTAPFRGTLGSVDVSAPATLPDDWEIVLFGRVYDISPRRYLDRVWPGYYAALVWLLWISAAIMWAYWVASELYSFIANTAAAAQIAASSSSGGGGLFGLLFKKLGFILELFVIGFLVWVLVLLQGVLLAWLLGAAFPQIPQNFGQAPGAAASAWAKIWRMANDVVPLSTFVALSLNSILVKLWLSGLLGLILGSSVVVARAVSALRLLVPLLFLPAVQAGWHFYNQGTNTFRIQNTDTGDWLLCPPGNVAYMPSGPYSIRATSIAYWSGTLADGDKVYPMLVGQGTLRLNIESTARTWDYAFGVLGSVAVGWLMVWLVKAWYRVTVEEGA